MKERKGSENESERDFEKMCVSSLVIWRGVGKRDLSIWNKLNEKERSSSMNRLRRAVFINLFYFFNNNY